MGKGSGYGKVILFNEHFVVHGIPGIASAIDSKTDAEVEKTSGTGITIVDERKGTVGYSEKKKSQQMESIKKILRMMDLNPEENPMEIWLGGELPAFGGIGASAASSVAIARAISNEFKMNLSDDRINEIAYEAEKYYAGNPSGIDNTAATYGGLIWFKRNSSCSNTIERLKIKKPIEIVMGNTGIVANTEAMVAGVAERKSKYPEKYNELFKQAEELAYEARKTLEKFDLKKLGELMNENHALLQQIEVSCKELDHLVDLALEQGAYGAKMTGGGGGGCMVALTPGKKLQKRVAIAMEKEGFMVLRTKVGVKKYT